MNDPLPAYPGFYPCPHCGEQLAVRTGTPQGERARCGTCLKPHEYRNGALHRTHPNAVRPKDRVTR